MILQVRGRGQVESRSFALTDMVRYGYSGLRNLSGGQATVKTIRGVPAVGRAVRLRSEAVASLRLRVWRGEAPSEQRVTGSWQARLFGQARYNEYQDRFAFWETIEESLSYRGNGFVWKLVDRSANRVLRLYALHPDQVKPLGKGAYRVTVADGYVDPVGKGSATYEVDAATLLHFRGHGDGGQLLAPSPVEVFRDALAAPISRIRHEARMWSKGAAIQMGVQFPAGTTRSQAEEWREDFDATHEGTEGGTTMVVGGGATLQKIGLSPVDAQFVDMSLLTVQDAARMFGVHAALMGVQMQRSENLEQILQWWLRFGLGPGLERIEAAIAADDDLFGGNTSDWPAFDTNGFVRGDLLTEATIQHLRIQDGTLLPDEGRHQQGLDPLPDGLGQIPQITPVGGAINPTLLPMPGMKPNQGD